MDNGWVKIHRKIQQNPIYRNSFYVHLWIHLLLKANHKGDKVMWNGGVLELKPGQMIAGRKKIALETGISEGTVERGLKYLVGQGQIGQQTNNRFRVITILNWKHYQETEQQTDSKRTTNGQQADTNKNVKKDKNVKNRPIAAKAAPTAIKLKEEIKKLYESPRRDLNLIGWYFEKRQPDIRTNEQFNSALKRHLRSAKQLEPFTDDQLGKAWQYVASEYPEWTLETLVKKLTK